MMVIFANRHGTRSTHPDRQADFPCFPEISCEAGHRSVSDETSLEVWEATVLQLDSVHGRVEVSSVATGCIRLGK